MPRVVKVIALAAAMIGAGTGLMLGLDWAKQNGYEDVVFAVLGYSLLFVFACKVADIIIPRRKFEP